MPFITKTVLNDGRDRLLGCPTLEFKWTRWHWCPRSKIYIWNPGENYINVHISPCQDKSISSASGWAHVFLWTVELFSEQKIVPTSDLPQWQLNLLITFTEPGHSCATTWLIFFPLPYSCRAEFSAVCYAKQSSPSDNTVSAVLLLWRSGLSAHRIYSNDANSSVLSRIGCI